MQKTTIPLSPVEFQLLACIEKQDGGKGTDLKCYYEKHAGKPIPHGTIYTTLRRLESKGLIKIKAPKKSLDQRTRHIAITSTGTAAIQESREAYRQLADFLTSS